MPLEGILSITDNYNITWVQNGYFHSKGVYTNNHETWSIENKFWIYCFQWLSPYIGEEQHTVASQKAHHLSGPMNNPQQPTLSSGLKSNLLLRYIDFQQDCQKQNHSKLVITIQRTQELATSNIYRYWAVKRECIGLVDLVEKFLLFQELLPLKLLQY